MLHRSDSARDSAPTWTDGCVPSRFVGSTGAEVVNVADDPAYAALAETLRAHLYAGWRSAKGAAPWPAAPKLPPPVEVNGCPMIAIP